ncbi:MAG: GIY-YIG nuclease family protein [Cyclobacteriaceae bacterium]|jgi:putative endonuclease
MEFQVYILQSLTTNRYYVGQTNNLEKRLDEHNSEVAGHTKKEQPWKLVWHKTVSTRGEALLLERKIKKRGASRFLEDLSRSQPG